MIGKVVVTGIGAVTPLGLSFEDSLRGLLHGTTGISPMEKCDVSGLPYTYAGQVKDLPVDERLTSRERSRYDPFIRYALESARQAIEDAGLSGSTVRDGYGDIGVVIGSSRAGISSLDAAIRKQAEEKNTRAAKRRTLSPYLMPSTTTSMAASVIAQKYGLKGECEGISNACASGVTAIGNAFRLIRQGLADMVIAGGAEAPLCRVSIEGYGVSGALSRRAGAYASSPFDIKRDGFVLSEGACVMILEEHEAAVRRGARIYGEIAGYARGMDAYHPTRPAAEGEARTIQKGLEDAGIGSGPIGFISAHAASTVLGDRAEAKALRIVFGDLTSTTPVSAFKSATGHMLAASGAFETAVSLMALKDGLIPPTINLDNKDPECDLNIVTEKKKAEIAYALINSFGFGGVNAVLIIKRAEENG